MKIKKFNENINFDNIENELIEKYNKDTKQYNVRVRIGPSKRDAGSNDLYAGAEHDNLDSAIKEYKKFVESNAKDVYYFITEETKTLRVIPTEEIEERIDANKYNL